jgi:hypothetical protein
MFERLVRTWRLGAPVALACMTLLAACATTAGGPSAVTVTGEIMNWDPGTDSAGALRGGDELRRAAGYFATLSDWVRGTVDAEGAFTITYALPTDTDWGMPLRTFFDDDENVGTCATLEGEGLDEPALVVVSLYHAVHGGVIQDYSVDNGAMNMMVYVAAPATAQGSECVFLGANPATVDITLAPGWNRIHRTGSADLVDDHATGTMWLWD